MGEHIFGEGADLPQSSPRPLSLPASPIRAAAQKTAEQPRRRRRRAAVARAVDRRLGAVELAEKVGDRPVGKLLLQEAEHMADRGFRDTALDAGRPPRLWQSVLSIPASSRHSRPLRKRSRLRQIISVGRGRRKQGPAHAICRNAIRCACGKILRHDRRRPPSGRQCGVLSRFRRARISGRWTSSGRRTRCPACTRAGPHC